MNTLKEPSKGEIKMTRKEAKKKSNEIIGYPTHSIALQKLIDEIYNDFESRTCEYCKYSKPILQNGITCKNSLLPFEYEGITLNLDFSCNKWESK